MDLKGLYHLAKNELTPLYDGEPLDLRLEQVERDKKTNRWNVVVSYLVENKKQSLANTNLIGSNPFATYERVYKLLQVNKKNEVEGLLMYNEAL
ncbi:MAG: hypothetical protein WA958_14875 [Tunicatimonas sp.]